MKFLQIALESLLYGWNLHIGFFDKQMQMDLDNVENIFENIIQLDAVGIPSYLITFWVPKVILSSPTVDLIEVHWHLQLWIITHFSIIFYLLPFLAYTLWYMFPVEKWKLGVQIIK